MLSHTQALDFLTQKVSNKNIIKHMLATEALMGGVYDALLVKGIKDLGGTKEEWQIAGLLHDGDYIESVPMERQGIEITNWLRKEGFEVPENVAYAMSSHNWEATKTAPKSLMDWTIYCGDSLTGLIVACALVMPTKKLADVSVESVLKKFKNKSFASGTRRQSIALCQDKIGFSLIEFIQISLSSMQEIHEDLGL